MSRWPRCKDDAGRRVPGASAGMAVRSQPSGDSWASLLTTGLKLVEALAAVTSTSINGDGTNGTDARWIETDAETGRTYLKLPVPERQVLHQLGEALSRLVSELAK